MRTSSEYPDYKIEKDMIYRNVGDKWKEIPTYITVYKNFERKMVSLSDFIRSFSKEEEIIFVKPKGNPRGRYIEPKEYIRITMEEFETMKKFNDDKIKECELLKKENDRLKERISRLQDLQS